MTLPDYRALTLTLHCPTCGAAPGALCQSDAGDDRLTNHWPRYAIARILTGEPLTREVPRRYQLDRPGT